MGPGAALRPTPWWDVLDAQEEEEAVTEPSDMYWIDSIAEPKFGIQVGGGVLTNVHPSEKCAGRPCVIHNPSDHHMKDWPTNWRGDARIMERMCPHGIGHPDPDDVDWHVSEGRDWMGVHGCDGCCHA